MENLLNQFAGNRVEVYVRGTGFAPYLAGGLVVRDGEFGTKENDGEWLPVSGVRGLEFAADGKLKQIVVAL